MILIYHFKSFIHSFHKYLLRVYVVINRIKQIQKNQKVKLRVKKLIK